MMVEIYLNVLLAPLGGDVSPQMFGELHLELIGVIRSETENLFLVRFKVY